MTDQVETTTLQTAEISRSPDIHTESVPNISQDEFKRDKLLEAQEVYGATGSTRLRNETHLFLTDLELDPNMANEQVRARFEEIVFALGSYQHIQEARWLILTDDGYLDFEFKTQLGQESGIEEATLTYSHLQITEQEYQELRTNLVGEYGNPLITQNLNQEYFVTKGEHHEKFESINPQIIISEYNAFLDKQTGKLMAELNGKVYEFSSIVQKDSAVYLQIPAIISALSEGKSYLMVSKDSISPATAQKTGIEIGSEVHILTLFTDGKAYNLVLPDTNLATIEKALNDLGIEINQNNIELTGGAVGITKDGLIAMLSGEPDLTNPEQNMLNSSPEKTTEVTTIPGFVYIPDLDMSLGIELGTDSVVDSNEPSMPLDFYESGDYDVPPLSPEPLTAPEVDLVVDDIEVVGVKITEETHGTILIVQETQEILYHEASHSIAEQSERFQEEVVATTEVASNNANQEEVVAEVSVVGLVQEVVGIEETDEKQAVSLTEASLSTNQSVDIHMAKDLQVEEKTPNSMVTDTKYVETLEGMMDLALSRDAEDLITQDEKVQAAPQVNIVQIHEKTKDQVVDHRGSVWRDIEVTKHAFDKDQIVEEAVVVQSQTSQVDTQVDFEKVTLALEAQVNDNFSWPLDLSTIEAYAIRQKVQDQLGVKIEEIFYSKEGNLSAKTTSGNLISLLTQ